MLLMFIQTWWVKFQDDKEANGNTPRPANQVIDIKAEGSKIRYGEPYGNAGSNVNFVEQIDNDRFAVRTYERGVEDETLSCGTGVTAVALAMHNIGKTDSKSVILETQGGILEVSFEVSDSGFKNIWLTGPATNVFKGTLDD